MPEEVIAVTVEETAAPLVTPAATAATTATQMAAGDERVASIFIPNTEADASEAECCPGEQKAPQAGAASQRWTTLGRRLTFNPKFPQKFKNMQDYWAQRKITFDRDSSHLLWICALCVAGVVFSFLAVFTNSWTCQAELGGRSFGLWNTCWQREQPGNASAFNSTLFVGSNETSWSNSTADKQVTITNSSGILCAKQGISGISVEYAEQSRIDQVAASQGLLMAGTILYLFSVFSMFVAYKFMNIQQNLNSMRNALVTAMFVQIAAFFMQLCGFMLFIMTDRFSVSISLLFVYFALAIFATNIINFITVEYRMHKSSKTHL